MRKLFFDDVRDAPDDTWMLARDVAGAKRLMQDYAFDVMSLDHDIGMQMMCEKCYAEIEKPVTTVMLASDKELEDKLRTGCQHSEHGTHLAQWMIDTLTVWPDLIIIHSANPYGADRMQGMLRNHTQTLRMNYDKEKLRRLG